MANFTVSVNTAIKIAVGRLKTWGRENNDLWEEAVTAFIEWIDENDTTYDLEMLADDFIVNHALEYTWEEFEDSFGLTMEDLTKDSSRFGGTIWAWNFNSVIFTN